MLTRQAQKGFSIMEILVSLAILAILAAMVIPTMSAKMREADGASIAKDLVAVQTAIKAFATDVHRFPGKLTQLENEIDGNAKDINATDYPLHIEDNWRGPYLIRDATQVLGPVDIDASFKPVTGDNGVKYATIQLNDVSFEEFQTIEAMLDAGTPSATSATAGVITYSNRVLKFLAVPML
jgi:general secretion pathway protein G